jgi:NTE family protein
MANVAIACQGGGSHTAFTAGVLQHLLAHDDHRIIALSGTSGGAICALLTWYGLHRSGPAEAARLLEGFWRANSASTFSEQLANAWLVGLAQLEGQVALPMVSPYAYPEVARATLTDLLGHQVDFDEVARLQQPPTDRRPLLLVGAVDVATGAHRAFSSWRGEITLNAILASAAVPPLFRAVHEAGSYYWDGLFSQNPPVRELPDADPEQIWVIRINPLARAREPTAIADIADRRNELRATCRWNRSCTSSARSISGLSGSTAATGISRCVRSRSTGTSTWRASSIAAPGSSPNSGARDGRRRSGSWPGCPDSQGRSSPRSGQRDPRVAAHCHLVRGSHGRCRVKAQSSDFASQAKRCEPPLTSRFVIPCCPVLSPRFR